MRLQVKGRIIYVAQIRLQKKKLRNKKRPALWITLAYDMHDKRCFDYFSKSNLELYGKAYMFIIFRMNKNNKFKNNNLYIESDNSDKNKFNI